jgi:adenylosuccinate synthase
MPSGILHESVICVLGNGVVIHVPTFFDEVKSLEDQGIPYAGRQVHSLRRNFVFFNLFIHFV